MIHDPAMAATMILAIFAPMVLGLAISIGLVVRDMRRVGRRS